MKRSTLILSLLIVAGLLLGACGQQSSGTSGKTYVIATDATWPPFEQVNESSKQIEGFDIDLMKAIADKGGFKVEFKNVSFDPLLAGMASCQYDAAISAITITPERAKDMAFSDPYFEAGQVVTVQTSNTDIKSKDDLKGKTVGAQIGTTGAIETGKLGANLKTYDDISLAFQDLMNGQVAAVVADNPLALGYVGKNPDKLKTVGSVFTDENYGIAVCKTNTELLQKINTGLAAVKSAGTVTQLTNQWISASK